MTLSSKALCAIYALIAVAAVVGTWGHNIAYLHLGWLGANLQFWNDTLVSEASTSITIDIFFLALAVNLWSVLEARRIGLRGVWLYILAGIFIAISVAFPLFLIHRERVLARGTGPAPGGTLRAGDVVGLLVLTIVTLTFTARTFLH